MTGPRGSAEHDQRWQHRDEATCLLTDDGRIVHVSSSIEQLAGVQPRSLVDRSFVELLDPADAPRFEQTRSRSGERGAPESFEVALRFPDGGRRRCRVVVESVPSSAVQPVAVVLIQDIEPDLRLQREARLLRRVTEACNEASATDALFDRCVRDIRTTMSWQTGRVLRVDDSGELVPSPPVGAASPADAGVGRWPDDGLADAVQRAQRSGRPVFVDLPEPPGGSPTVDRPRGQAAVPVVADERVTAVLEFLTSEAVDAWSHGDLEKLFANIGVQLGSVVERQAALAALGANAEELERSNAELERFAYIASHDLQEPLRKIVGFSELLVQRSGEALDETGREFVSYVVDGARRMQSLIRDLLAYSRIGRRAAVREPVDLGELVGDVLAALDWTLEEASATVDVAPLPTVTGDPGQLRELLTNLLTNAVKYTREHADGPDISVTAAPADEERFWEIAVADDGIGIDAEYRDQIFEVFRRLHNISEYPGTGIGLAIAQRIVASHGGTIWVTGNERGGSTFRFTLPEAREEAP